MTTTFTIAVIAPSLLNTNGDAENARVLARRAEWAGETATIVAVEAASDLPEGVDAVVIGSGSDSALVPARDLLLEIQEQLRIWSTSGVPILAVGTGWELISWGVERSIGGVVEGLGILAGRGVPRQDRVSGDLVLSSRFGRIVGFENHARDYVGAEGSPLGRVLSGSGNGSGSSQEGVVMGDVIGTHLHGPVLAKNPALADHLLTSMFERRGLVYQRGERAASVDDYAVAARNQILTGLGLDTD
ncbi:cobyric acid synthase [Leifsonia sp. YIM 134122]|uniref:Lipid II isoglutaminyl synthase (glutamine-hydrolyzing) subunit GatD n=1 Tax=Leifsonia stereocauli TaxID=3134136 RepID=A0ABU9W1E6_9MICO